MGDLLRFPHSAHNEDQPSTINGSPASIPEPRETAEEEPQQEAPISTGTELVPDTASRAVQRLARRPVIPPALAGTASKAVHAAGPATMFTARHLYYLGGGMWDTASATYSRWTGRDIDDRIRAAQAAGEHGVAAELMRQRIENRKLFLERIRVFGQFLLRLPLIVGGLSVLVLVITLLVSVVALCQQGTTAFEHIWTGLFDAVVAGFDWTVWAATVPAPILTLAGIAGVLVKGYNRRRRAGNAPGWIQQPTNGTRSEVVNITPHIVVAALRNLGISALRKAIDDAEDSGAWMLGLVTRYGPGAQVHVKLPPQVNTDDVRKRRDTLAGNLDRAAHEVQIEPDPASEREFTLWVADSGALDRPVPPSPLLDEDYGPVDIYRDTMPWGLSPKGDPMELNLLQQHFLLTGLSKQGKTAAARALALWASLDPSVRFRIADLKGFGDWSMFKDLAETLVEGAGEENFIATCDILEWGVGEMERRYERWRELGRKGDVDRASSQPGSGFEPLILIVDEAQKLYGCTTVHPDGGDIGGKGKKSRAVRAAQALHDQGRAVNLHLWQFSQNPTDANLPVVVREGAMIRASLFVGTESIARMSLGDAPVDTGAEPHALRAGLDRGTVVLAPGESLDLPGGATHITVRTHFIDTKQSYGIAERAKGFRNGVQHHQDADEERDLLVDVADVLGHEDKLKATDVVARLRTLAGPGYQPYQRLNADKLKTRLDALGVQVTKAGVLMVYTDRVHGALAAREGRNDPQ
jgi:S-DNA-T family DNA segregation ATPase FtsK/SpoIIIE